MHPAFLAIARKASISEIDYINMSSAFNAAISTDKLSIKMKGRKVYEYAIRHVPAAMQECLANAGVKIEAVKKIFIHQANEKMDQEIVARFYELYGIEAPPPGVMPMNIQLLGNSSLATIPTLYHMVRSNQIADQKVTTGDIVLFASVGAGMNINAVVYRV